ncbi:hypothetical protein TSUD_50530 [Trifolium subterraneum]|uniref:Uncharacterized protein n=1 Tax=Trifolium subterraneum TaxID=3900 RepID=A0A2Z6LHW4_TRISU|nr:hypothetical protein TSUD_50530 [Trifolium subterraneum]
MVSFSFPLFFLKNRRLKKLGNEENGNTLPRSRQHCIQPHWPFECENDSPQFPVVAEDCRSILFVECTVGGGRREAVIDTWSSSIGPLGAAD